MGKTDWVFLPGMRLLKNRFKLKGWRCRKALNLREILDECFYQPDREYNTVWKSTVSEVVHQLKVYRYFVKKHHINDPRSSWHALANLQSFAPTPSGHDITVAVNGFFELSRI